MHFDFATAHRILFGPGTAQQIGPAANTMGRRPLIVTGRTPDRV
ncbi:MAG: alcohol dehydrogenase, partial [Bryobacterales bacterium]|nr:alcohol dehydrogenase [Bryobacterales bacterium]